ncbi:MAG: hypothetical protein ABEJ92_04255 [Halobacteriales archaeon]
MIVVATADFEFYHAVVGELRGRDATFTTVEPGEPLPERTTVVITAPGDDEPAVADDVSVVVAEPGEPRRAVDAALSAGRSGGGRRVVGVDPGERPGVAVLDGDDVVAAFQVPLSDVPSVVARETASAPDPVVRVGDGARLRGSRLIDALDDVRVELVDEAGTTPHTGTGARGMGDVLAAVNIARRSGEPVAERAVEPTAGELTAIKAASRERSADNREITEVLARRVAAGELTLEEALEAHREG